LVDPLAREEPYEVVLGREVEARFARVALAARPSAELVVDPPRLVALCAQDVEAAELDYVVVVPLDVLLDPAEQRVPGLLELARVRLEPTAHELLMGQVLGVPAELDVHAAP